jgi:hypothetical protein
MSKTWVVWVDITHRIEVEADNMDDASDIAIETIWDETNMVNCIVTPELLEEDDDDDPVLEVEEAWERSFDDANT